MASYNDLGVEFKYLIVNDRDRRFGLCVNTVGVQAIRPNSPYPIKDHPSGYFSISIKVASCPNINYSTFQKEKVHSNRKILPNVRSKKGI